MVSSPICHLSKLVVMVEVLQEENVILCENSIDFAMKSQNPLDNVHFFDNFDSQHKYSMLKNTVSPMYPDIFQASHAFPQISVLNACTNTIISSITTQSAL